MAADAFCVQTTEYTAGSAPRNDKSDERASSAAAEDSCDLTQVFISQVELARCDLLTMDCWSEG